MDEAKLYEFFELPISNMMSLELEAKTSSKELFIRPSAYWMSFAKCPAGFKTVLVVTPKQLHIKF